MIKLSASNVKSDEESSLEELVAREGLDETASQQYAKALDLQRKGNLSDAIQLLKDLLGTQILYDVKKPVTSEKVQSPLLILKYLCYKKLAAMLSAVGEVEAAIQAYCSASELDDTNVNLWHQLGLLYIHVKRYELALAAFKRGWACNSQHWPCIDNVVTLSLGLDKRRECVAVIYDALQLDPGYLRGLVYRKHIYTVYKFERDYLESINPMYKWNEDNDMPIDDEKAEKLLKEADEIREICIKQQKDEQCKHTVPQLKLNKPITQLTWKAVGHALVDMHHYMTEKCFKHACPLEIMYNMEKQEESMDVCDEVLEERDVVDEKQEEIFTDTRKNTDIFMEYDNNDISDSDTPVTDTEEVESDNESTPTPETSKKKTGECHRSNYSYLQSVLKRIRRDRRLGPENPTTTATDNKDEFVYDTLTSIIPIGLVPKIDKRKEYEEKEKTLDISVEQSQQFKEKQVGIERINNLEYFDSEDEEIDVKLFINKCTEKEHNIIDILKNYLAILAGKWRLKWPRGLVKVFVEANKCYNTHADIPACTDDNKLELIHYTSVNLLAEELVVNDKLDSNEDDNGQHDLSVVESIGIILSLKPSIFSRADCLEYMLRVMWVKLHIHKLNKCDSLVLDSLNEIFNKLQASEEIQETYTLNAANFTVKPEINLKEIKDSIICIERNMKLKTIQNLYNKGNYEEVLTIVIDCFEHFKTLADQQEDRLTLDFAVYLTIILDTYWALGKVEDCFKSCFTCLHEALKHYFRYTSGSADYEKWTRTVLKILCNIEHILSSKGLSCLDALTEKDLSLGLQDLIRIICHQVETKATEMPFDTATPWIIMYYILQREEDLGRGTTSTDHALFDYVPYPLMVLFIGHAKLGKRRWCTKSDGKLLYFILDTVVPQLHSPSLSKCLEIVRLNIEQCVFCLFGYHVQKNKCLEDHKAMPKYLDWHRAQQLYDIFRPTELSRVEGKMSVITSDIASLFLDILNLLPSECDPHMYVPKMEEYMKGIKDKLPAVPCLLPYKMKDIYFLLGDYYLKDNSRCVKYHTLDVIINIDRFESWARIAMSKAVQLHQLLYSDKFSQCNILKTNKVFLNHAITVIRCFKRSLHLNPTRCDVWIEYGNFVYAVHSFCSRLLKQVGESLSMEGFKLLKKQKEDMLDTTQTCFNTVLGHFNSSNSSDMPNEKKWLCYCILGKVAEKRNKPPSVYLDYYMQGIRSLIEVGATYSTKINYSLPTKLCIEVLELHYRVHASILKYIEQHENKPIPESVGKVFASCIAEWLRGPFARRREQECSTDTEREIKLDEPVQAANILKRSVSDPGEDSYESKRLKLESAAAKEKRSAFRETPGIELNTGVEKSTEAMSSQETKSLEDTVHIMDLNNEKADPTVLKVIQNTAPEKKVGRSSSTSSTSSDSSSDDSTSDSSSDSCRDSDTSSKSSNESKPLTEYEIKKIVSACLDALEDCASRFQPHYKAIYRLAHYHFHYKKGKNIERCKDLMLSTFTCRFGQKLGGLFSERNNKNLFNNVCKLPLSEVDRGGSFPFHMNRSVLLTLEILKEIDDHKTLLDLALYLQAFPISKYKCLPNPDREKLAEQAFSLCVQSLKCQMIRFSQQADLKSNDVEQQALKRLMLDIYYAYQRVRKQSNSSQFTNLLIDGYKLLGSEPFDNKVSVHLIMKYCQSLQ